jgi:hypothetical protein
VTDKVIVLFHGKVAFKHYIPKKHTHFKSKFTGSVILMATCDMVLYFGKDRKWATKDITASHVTVKQLTRRVKGHGHKLQMDNYFSSPDLHNNLTGQKLNCRSTVRSNCKGMPDDFRSKILKLKWGDTRVRTSGDMTAVVWKDKCDVHMLTKIHDPSIVFNVKHLQTCFWTKMSVRLPYPHRTTDRIRHLKVHIKEYKTRPICIINIKNKNGSYKYKNLDTTSCDPDTLLNKIH